MTRVFPTYRFLEAHNGWKQQFVHPSRVLQEQMWINIANNNGSTTLFPILCQGAQSFHPSGFFYGDNNPLVYSFSQIMFNLLLITTITRIVRFVLRPLKQPLVISQIIGGIIVGPSFLGRNKWFRRNITSDSAQFLVNNLGVMGFMFFVFIYGVKMDVGLMKKTGKLHLSTALFGITIPTIAVFVVALCMRKNMEKELAAIPTIGVLAGYLGITAFHVIYNILKELNLLNSDIGRFALSAAIIGDAFGMLSVVVFEAGRQGQTKTENAVWYMISLVALLAFIMLCVRPAMLWINNNTPEGHPVDGSFVILILLGVFVMGFVTDMFGIAIANGPLWLGLAVPDGPGLGATLVKKCKLITNDFLLPFTFIMVGSYIDFYALRASDWSDLKPLFIMVLTGYLTKFFSTWIAAFYWQMPLRDGLTLSLIMSLRGQIELLLFVHFIDKKILKLADFTLLVTMTTVLTATFTPLISILYDPTRPYIVNQRRNIQHNPPDQELKIVLCIFDTETINGLINLLDISNQTSNNPILVYALRLVQLVGRANPLFIDHEKQEVPPIYQCTPTVNLLERYQQMKGESLVKLRFFTAVAPKSSMFQNICELALEQETSLIILPFIRGGVYGVRSVNSQVLNNSPCSVAVLVDKGFLQITNVANSFRKTRHRFAVLFMGGADSREALVFADRIVSNNPNVILTVIRFFSHNSVGDNEMEKKLDDGVVTWFWVKNEMNQSVFYREVVVRNGEETIGAIQAMNDGAFDLMIVGRKQGINPVLLTGLSEWSENEELGLIGDYVASPDFFGNASVLVVQQQILRG